MTTAVQDGLDVLVDPTQSHSVVIRYKVNEGPHRGRQGLVLAVVFSSTRQIFRDQRGSSGPFVGLVRLQSQMVEVCPSREPRGGHGAARRRRHRTARPGSGPAGQTEAPSSVGHSPVRVESRRGRSPSSNIPDPNWEERREKSQNTVNRPSDRRTKEFCNCSLVLLNYK